MVISIGYCEARSRFICNNSVAAGFTLTLNVSNYNGYGVSCSGASDGQISVVVSGGVSPFIFQWSNGATTQTITGLPAGYYKVIVKDNIGDFDSVDVILTEPQSLSVALNSFQNVQFFLFYFLKKN